LKGLTPLHPTPAVSATSMSRVPQIPIHLLNRVHFNAKTIMAMVTWKFF
jgi:hypothetical protein